MNWLHELMDRKARFTMDVGHDPTKVYVTKDILREIEYQCNLKASVKAEPSKDPKLALVLGMKVHRLTGSKMMWLR